MGMIEQELQQLVLTLGERHLVTPVADHSALGIEPEPLELPEPCEPQVQALLVAEHLRLDDLDVDGGGLSGRWAAGG